MFMHVRDMGGCSMDSSDLLQQTSNFSDMLIQGAIISKAVYAFMCLFCLVLFTYGMYRRIRNHWHSEYFILLCASVFIWSLFSLLAVFIQSEQAAEVFDSLKHIGVVFIPPLLVFHVQRQVSYKEPHRTSIILLFLLPVVLSVMILSLYVFPQETSVFPVDEITQLSFFVFYLFSFFVLIRAYLWCFNVFYQMPRHMRRSTIYVLISISAIALLLILNIIWDRQIANLIPDSFRIDLWFPFIAPVLYVLLLFPLYSAQRIMPSADVIITSRQYVMGSLSTIILVLSRNNKILDWNRSDWGEGFPLPEPRFRESFDGYRVRMLEKRACRISPHNENIIIAKTGDKEIHFLVDTHVISNNKRTFGSIVEISEVTPVYTMLRYFEQIARYDQLTGMFNRNAYLHRVTQIAQSENMPLLILVGDVNRLKHVNDVHGHILGDLLLTTVSDVIKQAEPPDAFGARVGGDEFVVLVPNGSAEIALCFLQKIRDLCGQVKHPIIGSPSISWGFSIMTSTQESYNEVFSQADAMMYEDKRAQHFFRSSGLLPEEDTPQEHESNGLLPEEEAPQEHESSGLLPEE